MIGQPHTSPSIPPKVLWPVLIVVILGLAVGGFFLLNSYIYNEKQGDDTNAVVVTNIVKENVNENGSQTVNSERVQNEEHLNKMLVDYTGRGDTVYLIDVLSGDTSTILEEAPLYNALSAHLSPDGKYIVYTLVEERSSEGQSVTTPRVAAIRLIDLGTRKSQILRSFNLDELHPSNPKFSPEGNYLAYLSYTDDILFVNFLDIDSSSNSEYATPFFTDSYGSVNWAPDNGSVIVSLDNKIFRVSLEGEFEELYDGGELRTVDLITGGTRDIPTISLEAYSKNANALSNERNTIFFSKFSNDVDNIYRMDADGSDVQQLTFVQPDGENHLRYAGVSPDGTLALLIESPPGQEPTTSSITLYNFKTGEQAVIYQGAKYWNPRFSPDSKKIAFSDFWDDPGIFVYDIAEQTFSKLSDVTGQVIEWK